MPCDEFILQATRKPVCLSPGCWASQVLNIRGGLRALRLSEASVVCLLSSSRFRYLRVSVNVAARPIVERLLEPGPALHVRPELQGLRGHLERLALLLQRPREPRCERHHMERWKAGSSGQTASCTLLLRISTTKSVNDKTTWTLNFPENISLECVARSI